MTREEAIKWLKDMLQNYDLPMEQYQIALEMAIKALEQEPSGDLISQEYLFKVLDDFCGHDRTATITLDTLADLVYDMPSVNPQEPKKTGHWILTDDDFVYCSECEDSYYPRPIDASWYYCPHCGAKMVEPQERSDKE